MKAKKIDFEKALAELEALVEQMERGDQPLEASLEAFERGIRLVRECQQALDQAEQRIRILTENGEQPFTPESQPGNTHDD